MTSVVLRNNLDNLFSFQFDPLKAVLSDIVQQIQEHRELIHKI